MATSLCRATLLLFRSKQLKPFLFHSPPPSASLFSTLPPSSSPIYIQSIRAPIPNLTRLFSSRSNRTRSSTPKTFAFSDSDEDKNENSSNNKIATAAAAAVDKSKLPPPYDPFNKKPVIEEPKDPKDLQEIFHKMRTEGLINNAIKMFDALSKDGLTHEAMQLFAQIKDKGQMPDVVAHTAVIEAYANAGKGKDALKVFMRMLASGVQPNAYTYTVLVKGLAAGNDVKLLGEARKYLLEMMDKGIRPNAGTYTAVFEAFVREDKIDEARELLEKLKSKGFVADERGVKDHLNSKRGQVFRTVIDLLFSN